MIMSWITLNQRVFYRHLHDLIVPILPSYKREGKLFTIVMGCTGGQHCSAAFAER